MADLISASTQELVEELRSRGKASLIAIVPKVKKDGANPEDDVDLFTAGCLGDKGWLLTALHATVTDEIRKGWTPHEETDDA